MELLQKMLSGDRLSLARVITLIENRDPSLRKIMDKLYPLTGNAFILGITGPPGAGKSTVTDRLVAAIRKTGQKAAVVAIDPSSPFSGGAILGDRIRMQAHVSDPGVFIRSLGTRGKHGGLSHATKDVVMALDAAGYHWIIVETAGVGQTELDILKLAHGVCVVLVPESGDSIQMMKAGRMEIADLFVVNKCDRPEADRVVRELVNMIHLGSAASDQMFMPKEGHPAAHSGANEAKDADTSVCGSANGWTIPVVKTQAVFDQGIDELFQAIVSYRDHAQSAGTVEKKRTAFLKDEILEILVDRLSKNLSQELQTSEGSQLFQDLLQRRVTPYEAADRLAKNNG